MTPTPPFAASLAACSIALALAGCMSDRSGRADAADQGSGDAPDAADEASGDALPDGAPDAPDEDAPDTADTSNAPPDVTVDTSAAPDTATTTAPGDRLFRLDDVAVVSIELDEASWQAILADPAAEAWQTGALVYDGERLEQIRVRVKGNSSLKSPTNLGSHRFPFKVDLDDLVDGQRLDGEEKLVFNNGFKDPTFLRETLGYELMRALGVPAPRTAFVDLSVAGEHLGLYTMAEVVDKRFLRQHFEDDDGDLYKPERAAGTLAYVGDAPGLYPDMELESNEDTSDGSTFVALVKALAEGRPDDVLEVDLALRCLAVSTLLVNLDSYLGTGHNYYLYEVAGRFTVIPWDLNEAFGTFSCGCNRSQLMSFEIDDPTCGAPSRRPLVDVLLSDPARLEAYHAHLEALLAGPFSEASMQARVDALAALIRPYVEADPTRFYTLAAFETGLTNDVSLGAGPTGGSSIGLMAFVRERAAAVRAQLQGTATATAPDGACPGFGPPPR